MGHLSRARLCIYSLGRSYPLDAYEAFREAIQVCQTGGGAQGGAPNSARGPGRMERRYQYGSGQSQYVRKPPRRPFEVVLVRY